MTTNKTKWESIASVLDRAQSVGLISVLDSSQFDFMDLLIVAKKSKNGELDHLDLKDPKNIINSCQILAVKTGLCSDVQFGQLIYL